jgi:hypothetical protein
MEHGRPDERSISMEHGLIPLRPMVISIWVRVPSPVFFWRTKVDDFVKSRNQAAKKKDPDARRANPEE